MIAVVLAAAVLVAIALPHAMPLKRAEPAVAISLWMASLSLRALLSVYAVIWLAVYLPATDVFRAMTHWCWHAVLPLLATHLGLSGHRLGDAAAVLPGVLLAASLLSLAVGLWRVARSVRRLVSTAALGKGPRGSLIVGGPGVLVAAAGLGRPRVVVSAGALARLDDEELAAALDHERGHIARRHRYLVIYAETCRALGRWVPGARRATRELGYQLERDADRWALRSHDRFALASAIVKAARDAPHAASPAFAPLAGTSDVELRLGDLVEDRRASSRAARRLMRGAAAVACLLTLVVGASVPPAIAAGIGLAPAQASHRCPG